MTEDTAPPQPPIIEPWRIMALILITVAGMVFAHAVTPSHAEAVTQPSAVSRLR